MGVNRIILSSVLALLSGPALGLSCLPQDVGQSFQMLKDADQEYFVAMGQIEYPEVPPEIPSFVQLDNTPVAGQFSTKALFNGAALSKFGLKNPEQLDVTVTVGCIANWCGAFPDPSNEILAFVSVDEGAYSISFGACPGPSILSPTDKDIRKARRCLRGKSCLPSLR